MFLVYYSTNSIIFWFMSKSGTLWVFIKVAVSSWKCCIINLIASLKFLLSFFNLQTTVFLSSLLSSRGRLEKTGVMNTWIWWVQRKKINENVKYLNLVEINMDFSRYTFFTKYHSLDFYLGLAACCFVIHCFRAVLAALTLCQVEYLGIIDTLFTKEMLSTKTFNISRFSSVIFFPSS